MQLAWICFGTPFLSFLWPFDSRAWLTQVQGLGPTCLFAHSVLWIMCLCSDEKRKFVETILVIIILLTRRQYRSTTKKNHISFCGILSSVYCILVTHSLHRKSNLTVTMCVTQFSGVWNYFSWYRLKNGWCSYAWSLGFDYWCHALKLKSEAERQASTVNSIEE